MASTRRNSETERKRPAPAITREARESQMIALAEDAAERMIREGSASSQIIVHYLKLGSTREQVEQRKLELEADLRAKQVESLESAARVEEMYKEALDAMRNYQGQPSREYDD